MKKATRRMYAEHPAMGVHGGFYPWMLNTPIEEIGAQIADAARENGTLLRIVTEHFVYVYSWGQYSCHWESLMVFPRGKAKAVIMAARAKLRPKVRLWEETRRG